MRMRTLSLMLILLICLPIISAVSTDVFYPLSGEKEKANLLSAIPFLTVVNGATCATDPFDSGFTWSSKSIMCPKSILNLDDGTFVDNQGCRVLIWNGYYEEFIREFDLNAGVTDLVPSGKTYEVYYCSELQCSCVGERDGVCGGGSCPETMMQRLRDCVPDQCSWEETCIVFPACQKVCTPSWTCGAWSECSSEGKRTRKCIDESVCGTNEARPAEIETCVPPASCGDGTCSPDENKIDCPEDCKEGLVDRLNLTTKKLVIGGSIIGILILLYLIFWRWR